MTGSNGGTGEVRCPIPACLDEVLEHLIEGRAGLHEVPAVLHDAYLYGYNDGRASLEPDLERANDEADRLYQLAADSRRNARVVAQLLERQRVQAARRTHRKGAA